jgi:hypothetical protein
MAQIPLEELELQLATVQAAITALLQGKRLTSLRVGSGTFQRLYTYQEIDLEHLILLRDELLEAIDAQTPDDVVFKKHAHIPMLVSKGIW